MSINLNPNYKALWTRTAGDVGDTIIAELTGIDNLDNVTAVTASVWDDQAAAPVTVALSGAVTDSANRLVTITLGTWLQGLTLAARYALRIHLVDATGGNISWPESETPPVIEVAAKAPAVA